MQVSASSYGQLISLKVKDASLQSVIKEISKQSGYDFFYDLDLVKQKTITVNISNASVETALKQCLAEQPIEYNIENKSVLLRAKKPSFPNDLRDRAAVIMVRGHVLDDENRPLQGATVKVKGTTRETRTNDKGEFSIENVAEDAMIEISFVGYITRLMKASTNMTVRMQVSSSDLQEVTINKGYYRTTKELNTGSVSTVTAASLSRQPVSDPLFALHGQVTGLYLSAQTGVPGAQSTVRLRGMNSIANGNDPLYIVDGIPFSSNAITNPNVTPAGTPTSPFSLLNMEDIESIDVLKDADATAIYGSRGANGVILITTKKGTAGKTTVTANFNKGYGGSVNKYGFMNTAEYLSMRKEAFANDNVVIPATAYDLNGTWDQGSYTDWEDVLTGGTAELTNAYANVTGGSALTQFLISGNYRKETSVYPGNFNDRKLSVHSNINNLSVNGKLTTSFTASYSNDKSILPITDITADIVLSPNTPAIYNNDGTLNWANSTWTNPFGAMNNFASTQVAENLSSTLNIGYTVLPGLSISARLGYNKILTETDKRLPAEGRDPAQPITVNSRRHEFGSRTNDSWIVEPTINFNKAFKYGKLETILGATFQESSYESRALIGTGFSSDALLDDFSAASSLTSTTAQISLYRYNAIFARIGYTYKERYVLNVTGRRDGSSRFGPGKQFGNFGAIGAAWIFSKEKIFSDTFPFINFGKLRASYGITGNDQLPDYKYLSTYSSSSITYQGIPGLNPTQHTNPFYGWENVKKLEAAIDFGVLQDRIQGTVNWYRNRTGNQLVGYPLPAITGFTTVQANLPAVVQNTGWEVELSGKPLHGKKLNWTISANLSVPKNKLVSYPNLAASSFATRYEIGQPLFIAQRYHLLGVDPQTGIYTFQDKNGDGLISTTLDRYPVFVGQRYFGGLTNQLNYKGIEFSFLFQYVKQQGYDNNIVSTPGRMGNISKSFADHWKVPGDLATYQKFTQSPSTPAGVAYALYRESDGIIKDKSFIRLRNVSISWSLPSSWIKRIGFEQLKIYAQAQNLLTITGYDGVDPEIATTSLALPPLRMTTIGIQASIN